MIEFAHVPATYESEDRANLFMTNIIEQSRDFPDLMITGINDTLTDLSENGWLTKKFRDINSSKATRTYAEGHRLEIKSATEMYISVEIYGMQRKRIWEFEKLSDQISKHFLGVRSNESFLDDKPTNDEQYRLFTVLEYRFR